MQSSGSLSGSSIEGNGLDSPKMTSTSAKGSASLASARKDSNRSRSSTRVMSINKPASPRTLSSGNTKIFEKPLFKAKRTPKWIDKRQMTGSMRRSDKDDQYFSCFSVSKMPGKLSSSFHYEQVELVSPQGVVKPRDGNCSTNVKRVADPGNNPSSRMICDARSYREWLRSGASKDKVSGSYGRLSVTSAEACKEVKEEVVESHLSCTKRRRVDFDSTQQCYSCNAELGNTLHSVFPVQDGKELISELNMYQTEEYSSDVLDKESQLEIKTGSGHNACVTCMLGGKLLSCVGKGCKRKFHLSCLVPALGNEPPGVWHCVWCVKKKKELGVHSVSELESIWDAREVVSDKKAMQSEKQYLVKYRGLAHVHNRWIPEQKLLFEAPTLVTKYNSKNQFFQVIRWKSEWAVPQRLLQKRKLLFPTNSDENNLHCTSEWLVKWTGLGYEQATWELENSLFLTSPEAMELIRDFEIRHKKSERLSSHSEKEKENCTISELSHLSFGGSSGEYDHYLSYVNKLLAHWHKNQNAVVYDDQADQERVIKVILFVLSLQFTARRPSLIISKSAALSLWESEFLRVASSANIIIYKGSKDVWSSIRSLEFYNESGSIMFEILLSSSDVVAEDLDMLKCIEWGAIIIDECQRPRMSRYFEQFKRLIADMKLLLVSGQIKDCSADYQNILSLLDSGCEISSDDVKIDSNTDVCKLKERFARYFAFEYKLGFSRFVEYWVPVQLSYLQLEQYCATLLSNSMLLSSSLKSDPVDALRELIISIRKCCDHPYLLDQSLQGIAAKSLSAEENLDVGIKVSGKLQILDKILLETKARGLRVLILFQPIGGSGRDSVGNILDDFLCQRFGKYSYVRIDGGGYAHSKKKAVVSMFNNKDSGRPFLLLEDRACLPSIKLSAVDVVILFDSDWEPQNDIKALHKISISSQFELLRVFRLYSSFTVEEKILILAKEGRSVDSNIRTLSRNSCLRLLSWGASNLFNKLDDFHGCSKSVSVSNVSCEQSFLNAVLSELLTQLPCGGESNHSANCSFITEVPQNVVYDRNISLFGEKEIGSMGNEPSIFSWLKLLEGRHPQWKLLTESSPRNRKKVQYLDNFPRKSEFEYDGVIKKSRMAVNSIDDPTYPKWKFKGKRKVTVVNKKRKLAAASKNISEKIFPCSADGKKDVNQNNQLLLKLGISKLCEVLQLPEDVRGTTVAFLEYIMQDYDVSWESLSLLQAYQISLCLTAADLLKYKIDQNKSLALAKLRLNLDCRDEEVEFIYSNLQSVAKKFAQCSEKIKSYKKSNCLKKVHINPQYSVHKPIPSTPRCNQSGTVQSASPNDPDESLSEKTVSSLPVKIVDGHFGSDSELGCPSDQPKDHTLVSDSQQHQSPLRLPATESVAEPSEIPRAQCNAVVRGNATHATQYNEESVEIDAVASERETVSKISQHDTAVTYLPGDSNGMEFIRTRQSLVEADVNFIESNSLLCKETALSFLRPIRPSSSESNISIIPASGMQHHLSSIQHALCQEVAVPRHPSLEVPLDESSGSPIMLSVTLLPQQPSASTPVLGSETCIGNQRSTNTMLRSLNELPCQVNTVRPVTPQPACSNPLQIELERIEKYKDQTLKLHEDMILQLKSERDKEIEEICKKYDVLLRDAEIAFKQKEQDLECYCSRVQLNNLLAETVTYNLNEEAAGSTVIDSFINQLIQQTTSMLDPRIEPPLTGLGAAPPVQTSNDSPTGVVAQHSSPTIHVARSNWVGIVRAPAPHLRALNPPSMSTPHVSASHGKDAQSAISSNTKTILAVDLPVFNSYV
ncbi:chromodomain-helicase-DNA-binding protein 3-like [Durio zibethinus]|uniref:Chromodomain-helicase-DNA-binding protein 3-like n=1 Tax=Durio zibethinus TaxID=66656 RepID=A0A6P5YV05_DURZI|nr:chromodomain-helicase-DNA-binding protein 3-like [Durio zibethinus]